MWFEVRATFRRLASWCTPRGKCVCIQAWLMARLPSHWSCRYHNNCCHCSPRRARSLRTTDCGSKCKSRPNTVNNGVHRGILGTCDRMGASCCSFCSSDRCTLVCGIRQQKLPQGWSRALWEAPSRIGTWERLCASQLLHSSFRCDMALSCSLCRSFWCMMSIWHGIWPYV